MSWNWLNTHALGIQAVSAFALIWLTLALVGLTAILAWVGFSQLRAQREEAAVRRRKLEADIQFLETIAKALPGPTTNPEVMTNALIRDAIVDWSDFDYGRFRLAASESSLEAGRLASVVEWSMKRLAERVALIRSHIACGAFDWNRFDWLVWNSSLDQARGALEKIGNKLGTTAVPSADLSRLLFRG